MNEVFSLEPKTNPFIGKLNLIHFQFFIVKDMAQTIFPFLQCVMKCSLFTKSSSVVHKKTIISSILKKKKKKNLSWSCLIFVPFYKLSVGPLLLSQFFHLSIPFKFFSPNELFYVITFCSFLGILHLGFPCPFPPKLVV